MIVYKNITKNNKQIELLFFDNGDVGVKRCLETYYMFKNWFWKIFTRPIWNWFNDERELERLIDKIANEKVTAGNYNKLINKF